MHFPFFFSHDGKETKDLALAARRPFTALGAKTAKLASLEQTPFLRSLRPKGPRLRSLGIKKQLHLIAVSNGEHIYTVLFNVVINLMAILYGVWLVVSGLFSVGLCGFCINNAPFDKIMQNSLSQNGRFGHIW